MPQELKQRKKAHFARNKAKKLSMLPDDVIEIIIMRCLIYNGNIIRLFMMCNKALNQRLLGKHALWREMYLSWMHPEQVKLYKSVPDMMGIRKRTPHQPVDVSTFLREPVPNEIQFAKWMNKVNSLRWLSKCHCCKSSRRTIHKFWYMNKGFCSYCIPHFFISNQVLKHQYGIMMDSKVPRVGCAHDTRKTFANLVVNKVYFFYQQSNKAERETLTTAYEDFAISNDETLFFFCLEDLAKVVDLDVCKKEYELRRKSVQILWSRMDPVIQMCKTIQYTKDGERLTDDKSSLLVVLLHKIRKIYMDRSIRNMYRLKPKIDYHIDNVSRLLFMNDRFKLV